LAGLVHSRCLRSCPELTVLFYISTLIAQLTVIVGFMLFRTAVQLYIERRSDREGIRPKLVVRAPSVRASYLSREPWPAELVQSSG
jgi:hypothetical protein